MRPRGSWRGRRLTCTRTCWRFLPSFRGRRKESRRVWRRVGIADRPFRSRPPFCTTSAASQQFPSLSSSSPPTSESTRRCPRYSLKDSRRQRRALCTDAAMLETRRTLCLGQLVKQCRLEAFQRRLVLRHLQNQTRPALFQIAPFVAHHDVQQLIRQSLGPPLQLSMGLFVRSCIMPVVSRQS